MIYIISFSKVAIIIIIMCLNCVNKVKLDDYPNAVLCHLNIMYYAGVENTINATDTMKYMFMNYRRKPLIFSIKNGNEDVPGSENYYFKYFYYMGINASILDIQWPDYYKIIEDNPLMIYTENEGNLPPYFVRYFYYLGKNVDVRLVQWPTVFCRALFNEDNEDDNEDIIIINDNGDFAMSSYPNNPINIHIDNELDLFPEGEPSEMLRDKRQNCVAVLNQANIFDFVNKKLLFNQFYFNNFRHEHYIVQEYEKHVLGKTRMFPDTKAAGTWSLNIDLVTAPIEIVQLALQYDN